MAKNPNYKGWYRGMGDESNSPVLVAVVDDTSKALHIASAAYADTDWNVSADSNPALYIHSNTTPATDYIKIYHDGAYGYFDVVGGAQFSFLGGLLVTDASLNATTGRVGKFSGTVAAPNFGDGYGAFEVDITSSGTVAGESAAFSSWLNLAAGSVPGANRLSAQNNGIYVPTGITASSAKMIIGARMHYVADDGANPGSLFCFSTNIYSNVLTAIFDVNAIVDLGGSTGAQTGNDYKIPLLRDATAGQTWYVNVYHS